MYKDFSDLSGLILSEINVIKGIDGIDDHIVFKTNDNRTFRMYHSQDCCEYVYIDDICGDIKDLIGYPILIAEKVSNSNEDQNFIVDDDFDPEIKSDESWTWTFYKLATINGYVTIKWYGSSNGYYSESVEFYEDI